MYIYVCFVDDGGFYFVLLIGINGGMKLRDGLDASGRKPKVKTTKLQFFY